LLTITAVCPVAIASYIQDPNAKKDYRTEVDKQLTKIQEQVTELRDLVSSLDSSDNLQGAALLEVRGARAPRLCVA